MEPQHSFERIIAVQRQDLHLELLYLPDVSNDLKTTYRILKYYIVFKDFLYTANPFVRRVIYGLINIIYTEEADRNRALLLLENPATSIFTTVPAIVPTSISNPSIPTTYFDVDQKEQNKQNKQNIVSVIVNKFKKEDWFSGKIGADVNEYIANYSDTYNDINVHNDFR